MVLAQQERGKTFLAVAAAVEALERQEIRRVLLTRPAVEAGRKARFFTRGFRSENRTLFTPAFMMLCLKC